MPERVVGSELDGFLGRDQKNVHGRSLVHPEVALCLVSLFKTVKPEASLFTVSTRAFIAFLRFFLPKAPGRSSEAVVEHRVTSDEVFKKQSVENSRASVFN